MAFLNLVALILVAWAGLYQRTDNFITYRTAALLDRCGVHLHRLREARSSTSRERSGAPSGKSILPGGPGRRSSPAHRSAIRWSEVRAGTDSANCRN